MGDKNKEDKETRAGFDIRDAIDALLWPFFIFIVVLVAGICIVSAFNWLRSILNF